MQTNIIEHAEVAVRLYKHEGADADKVRGRDTEVS